MDEDISIIKSNVRNEKIKNFFVNNKKLIISFLIFIFILLSSYFILKEYKANKKENISNKYNSIIVQYSEKNKNVSKEALTKLVYMNDATYSPLSLFFILDKKLIEDKSEINKMFDVIIEKASLDTEIKNLIIYKKALFNADNIEENQLLSILNPLINSESIWKSHALYLMGEYFYSKNEKQKSKEFFNQVLSLKNANQDLIIEAQKRLSRDLRD